MLFTSLEFFFFLPLVLAAFSIVPVAQRWAVLLFASYVFYGFWHPFNLVYLGAVTDRANFFFANCRSGRTMVRSPRPRADRPARATGSAAPPPRSPNHSTPRGGDHHWLSDCGQRQGGRAARSLRLRRQAGGPAGRDQCHRRRHNAQAIGAASRAGGFRGSARHLRN